jgi:hypothetical protein
MAFLNISKKVKNGILADIDRQNYFLLGSGASGVNRINLYNFALALGYNQGFPTDLDAKESFVREENVNHSNLRFMYSAVYFEAHEKKCVDNIENIINTDEIFSLMDKYANAGFSILSDYIKEHGDNALAFKLIAEMDEMNENLNDIVE